MDRAGVRETLGAYLDGALSSAERAEAERLLAENAEARAYLEELRALRTELRRVPGIAFSRDRTAELLARLPADAPSPPLLERLRAWFPEGSLLRPAFAAVAAAALGTALWSYWGLRVPAEERRFAALAPDLALYEDLEVVEDLDGLEDFAVIFALPEGRG